MSILSGAGTIGSPLISLRDTNSKMAFFFFAREFLPCIVKRLYFRQNKYECQLSDFVTVSDEAFTLLVLENNVTRWNAMFSVGINKGDKNTPPQKFQNVGGGIVDSTCGGKDGYSTQAIRRYNEYYISVEMARKEQTAYAIEYELMERMKDLDRGKKHSGRTSKRKRDGELNTEEENGAPIMVRFDPL